MHKVVDYLLNPVVKTMELVVVITSLAEKIFLAVLNRATYTKSMHRNSPPLTTLKYLNLYLYFDSLSTSSTGLSTSTTNLILFRSS